MIVVDDEPVQPPEIKKRLGEVAIATNLRISSTTFAENERFYVLRAECSFCHTPTPIAHPETAFFREARRILFPCPFLVKCRGCESEVIWELDRPLDYAKNLRQILFPDPNEAGP